MSYWRPKEPGKYSNPTLRMIRRAQTAATTSHGIGGVKKLGHTAPKPITLPKVSCLDDSASAAGADGRAQKEEGE